VTSWSLVDRYHQHFREICWLHRFYNNDEAACVSETLVPTDQITFHHFRENHNIFILIAMRTSNLIMKKSELQNVYYQWKFNASTSLTKTEETNNYSYRNHEVVILTWECTELYFQVQYTPSQHLLKKEEIYLFVCHKGFKVMLKNLKHFLILIVIPPSYGNLCYQKPCSGDHHVDITTKSDDFICILVLLYLG
jgi:hypothetical protein